MQRYTILLTRVSEQSLVQGFVERFRDQHTITVATGVTCAYLGDERNLREYLVADEVVKALKANGHLVHFYCFDDDLDALTFRQLRVAVNKDPDLVAKFEPHCGKPISDIRSPFSTEVSWAGYFEKEFVSRLSSLGCNPNLVSVSSMYDRGLYAPYVRQVLLHQDRIWSYLGEKFPTYRPEKLFWPICPMCGYIDGGTIDSADNCGVQISCQRCLRQCGVAYEELRGKLNWKLDCAARWAMFNVSAEPFSKAYLEPIAGSFYVAQGLSTTLFEGSEVVPIQYGSVTMDNSLSYKILDCLPSKIVRSLFVKNYKSDLDLTEQRVATEANREELFPDLTFAAMVKQLLPAWSLDSGELTPEQREWMGKGIQYSKHFENREIKPFLPNSGHLDGVPIDVLKQIQSIIHQVVIMRKSLGLSYDEFVGPAKAAIEKLGNQRQQVIRHFRTIIGQDQGVPNSRFLYMLPSSYLMNLESLIDLYVTTKGPTYGYAVVEDPTPLPTHQLRVVSGDG